MAWPKGRPNPHGGNRRGIPNKRTVARREAQIASGLMPLDYMLERMRDESLDPVQRMHAAATAAPYLHPRLASVETNVSGALTVEIAKFADQAA